MGGGQTHGITSEARPQDLNQQFAAAFFSPGCRPPPTTGFVRAGSPQSGTALRPPPYSAPPYMHTSPGYVAPGAQVFHGQQHPGQGVRPQAVVA